MRRDESGKGPITHESFARNGNGAVSELSSSAGNGTKKPVALVGVAASHSPYRAGGTITSMRFSSPGL